MKLSRRTLMGVGLASLTCGGRDVNAANDRIRLNEEELSKICHRPILEVDALRSYDTTF